MSGGRAERVERGDERFGSEWVRVLLATVRDAVADGCGGEVLVRCGEASARLYVVDHRIAWVVSSEQPTTFGQRLIAQGKVEKAALREVFAECKRTGANFAETLVAWELIEAGELRTELLAQIAEALAATLTHGRAETMFFPYRREYRGGLLFDLDELALATSARLDGAIGGAIEEWVAEQRLAADGDPSGIRLAGGVQERFEDQLADVMRTPGYLALAIVAPDGELLLHDDGGLAPRLREVATSLATLLAQSADTAFFTGMGAPECMALTAAEHVAITRRLDAAGRVLVVLGDRSANTALLQLKLARLAQR